MPFDRRASAGRGRADLGRAPRHRRSRRLPRAPATTAVHRTGHRAQGRAAADRALRRSSLKWSRTNVRPQKQDGYAIVIVTTVLGDLTSAQFRLLGELSQVYGDGTVRVTMDQNLLFRWVRTRTSRPSTRASRRRDWRVPGAGTLSDVTSCPGAESCKLAVTQSRGLGRVLADHLWSARISSRRCRGWTSRSAAARTAAASITSRASASRAASRRSASQPAPQYFVMVGGGVGDGITTFGRLAAKIPARRCVQRARAPGEAVPGSAQPTRIAARVLPPRRARRREGGARRSRAPAARRGRADRTSSISPRSGVQPRGDGRRVQRLASRASRSSDSQLCQRQPSHPFRCSTRSAGRRCCAPARLGGDAPGVEIYAKAEFQNPGGSVKDRAAAAIMRDAERSGRLRPGGIILDATSGNTGIAYAMIAAACGYRLKLCVPGNVTAERHAHAAGLRRRSRAHEPDGRHRRRDSRGAAPARGATRARTSTPISTTTTPTGARTTRPPPSRSSSRPTAASRTLSPASARAARSWAPAAGCGSSVVTSA